MILCKIRSDKNAEAAWWLDIPYWDSVKILDVATIQEARRIATREEIPKISFEYYPLNVNFQEL